MTSTEIKRPNYYEGQYLGARDLLAAQEYQRQQDQRHRLAAHTWGIAAGLELEERARQGGSADAIDVYLKPGYATDGFGRTIVVLESSKIPEALFAQFTFDVAFPDGRWISVWLQYREQKTDPPRPGFAVCDVEEQAFRILETFRIIVGELPSSQQRSQISIAGKLKDAANEFPDASVPYQVLPDPADAARWLVRLGSVRWLPPNPPLTTAGHFVKSQSDDEKRKASEGRPFIGVVAESVLAPAGKVRVRDRLKLWLAANETAHLAAIEGSFRVDGDVFVRGRVGIRTDAPQQDLSVKGGLNLDQANSNNGILNPGNGITFGSTSREGIASKRTGGGNQFGLDLYTKGIARLSITNAGDVGIGTLTPKSKLQVEGDVTLTGSLGVGTTTPTHKFHVLAGAAVGLFESTGTEAFLRLQTSEGPDNRVEITNRKGGRLSLWTAGGHDTLSITRNGNVGIGTTSPTLKLDIAGEFGSDDATQVHLFQSRIGDVGDGILFLRSGGDVVAFDGNDNVGIGTKSPAFKLDVVGDAQISGNLHLGGATIPSDERLKAKITPLKGVLAKVQRIRGISYEWNELYASLGYSTERRQIGLLAQEVGEVFPELVVAWGKQKYLGLDYPRFSAVLLEAIKELAEQNATLVKRIESLEKQPARAGQKDKKPPQPSKRKEK
jgi:hypothetical protein